jgi:DNA/RNA endonuclease YhcR with UshA esterase domain
MTLCSAILGWWAGFNASLRRSHRARFTAACAALVLSAFAAKAAELPVEEAPKHIGETATVCGVVASGKFNADSRSQPTFLDFGKPYPDQTFTAVIFGSDRTKFGTPETALRGKRVCVTGKIQDRSGLPEIILNDPKQLSE